MTQDGVADGPEATRPDPGAAQEGTEPAEGPASPVHRPHRDRPFTGDDAVDAALLDFDGSRDAPLAEQLAAADRAHRALQARLSGGS